jgi:diguanylate cyclase (GGDEF)-like protein
MNSEFQARLLVRIGWLIFFSLIPFLGYHLYQQNLAITAVLALVMVGEYFCIYYIERGGKPFWVAHLVSLTYSVGALFALYHIGSSAAFWLFPVAIANFATLPLRSALTFNFITVPVAVLLILPATDMAIRFFAAQFLFSVGGYIFSRQLNEQKAELDRLTRLDPLTMAGNRRALSEQLTAVAKIKQRHATSISAIMIDIDHFKRINDRFDHQTGDQVLVDIVSMLKQRLRQTDNIFRFGGEEFVVITLHTDLGRATRLAEDLRRVVATNLFVEGSKITISAGVAELEKDEHPQAWISRADKALYAAKKSGRNLVRQDPPSGIPDAQVPAL